MLMRYYEPLKPGARDNENAELVYILDDKNI